ncbi:MAG: helix-turn-helix transcriptional regulator [Actinomycetales bacterium]
MTEGATERLSRLLTMVPWLLTHQGVELSVAAGEFGVDEAQLVKDLELLFVCGTPGHLPDDLIEAEWEGGRVFVDNADTIARPLRLGVDEALALVVGLRTLAEVPGLGERAAVDRALAKLEAAAGAAAAGSRSVHVDLEAGAEAEVLAACREALAGRRRLRLDYLVPSRDETTRRDVDPMRVQTVESRWYLEAWCHRAEAVRLFRLDRIVDAEVLDVDGTPPAHARSRDLDEQLFSPGPDDLLVTLELAASARWVVDYYPVESVEDLAGGRMLVRLRTADTRWLQRLVLRLAGQARVVEPAELGSDVVRLAEEALSAYL